jgi:hypothetical protein
MVQAILSLMLAEHIRTEQQNIKHGLESSYVVASTFFISRLPMLM